MSQSQASPEGKAPKSKVSFITIPILIAVVAGGAWFLYHRHSTADRYNDIINNVVNKGKYKQGAKQLEEFLKTAPGHIKQQAEKDLAVCYKSIGADPSLSHAKRIEWLRKANALNPSVLTEQEKRLIEITSSIGGKPFVEPDSDSTQGQPPLPAVASPDSEK